MDFAIKLKNVLSVAIGLSISGCGTYVPEIQEAYQGPSDAQKLVFAILTKVYCEVKTSAQFLTLDDIDAASFQLSDGTVQGRKLEWLKDWGAQITMDLIVEEKSAFNPGVSFNTPMHNAVTNFDGQYIPTGTAAPFLSALTYSFLPTSQNYSFGLGGQFSADATRRGTISIFIKFGDFLDNKSLTAARSLKDGIEAAAKAVGSDDYSACNQNNGLFIEGDLKFRQQLYSSTLPVYGGKGSIPNFADALKAEAAISKKDVIQHDVNFILISGGSATPSWKLVRVSANQSGSLFSATRTRTQHVLITLGPLSGATKEQKKKSNTLAPDAAQLHAAAETAALFTNAFRTAQ